jgi:hypothetical protein
MSATLKAPVSMTVAEFLEWCLDDGQRWQLVDGEPVAANDVMLREPVLPVEILSASNARETWANGWPIPACRACGKSWCCARRRPARNCCGGTRRANGRRAR